MFRPFRKRKRQGARDEVAIYSPSARLYYERAPESSPDGGGGAELQTTRLARGLARRGRRTVHVVYPVTDRIEELPDSLRLVERSHYVGHGGPIAKLREALAIADSLARANADTYILRCFGLHLPVGVLVAKLARRRAIISGSNDIDFVPAAHGCGRISALIYRWAFKTADLIVCQTEQQAEVARREYPRQKTTVIRSFAEEAEPSTRPPEAFLWVGRVVGYKRPLAFVELAKQIPERKFRMVCIESSETSSALLAEIRRAAAPVDNLELLDAMPRERLMTVAGLRPRRGHRPRAGGPGRRQRDRGARRGRPRDRRRSRAAGPDGLKRPRLSARPPLAGSGPRRLGADA